MSQVYVNVLFGSKGLKYAKKVVKNWKKTENVVTYSNFSLFQGSPLKIRINSSIAIIRSSSVQKLGRPGLLFCQLLVNKHITGTKIPPL